MKYIVNVSGGLTSFEALRRTLDRYGKENTFATFADTLIEDEDLYRFLDDQERYFGIKIERVADGRTPFQVMKDERCIKMFQSDMVPCSKILKRKMLTCYIVETFKGQEYTQVFGMDWTEMHRVERLRETIAPTPAWFPLLEKPYTDKCRIASFLEEIGIKPPRLYEMGFAHNNCGGGCVRAGKAHFANLFYRLKDRYLMWEREEQDIRDYLGKDVAILRNNIKGTNIPMTLKEFRERLEAGVTDYDRNDWGGCGCFAPIAQLRMEDLLLQADVEVQG